jgi:uncharacterized protein CbrC (UPF0167 family)
MKKFIPFLLVMVATGCYYDSVEGLYPQLNATDPCSSEVPATFTASIQTIINLNCVSCHSAGSASGGIRLDSYQAVRSTTTNNLLVNVIERRPGFSAMPPSRALPTCEVEKIKLWITNGTPE